MCQRMYIPLVVGESLLHSNNATARGEKTILQLRVVYVEPRTQAHRGIYEENSASSPYQKFSVIFLA
jgi:hypothetical protein